VLLVRGGFAAVGRQFPAPESEASMSYEDKVLDSLRAIVRALYFLVGVLTVWAAHSLIGG
jgi:hypothetical protein